LAFALGLDFVLSLVMLGAFAAVFFRVFAAIYEFVSLENSWSVVVRGRCPRNEGRVRYQKIWVIAI
jgi:hypothetical protein